MKHWFGNNRATSPERQFVATAKHSQGKTWGNFWARHHQELVREEMQKLDKNSDNIGGRKTAIANCIRRLSEEEQQVWIDKFSEASSAALTPEEQERSAKCLTAQDLILTSSTLETESAS